MTSGDITLLSERSLLGLAHGWYSQKSADLPILVAALSPLLKGRKYGWRVTNNLLYGVEISQGADPHLVINAEYF